MKHRPPSGQLRLAPGATHDSNGRVHVGGRTPLYHKPGLTLRRTHSVSEGMLRAEILKSASSEVLGNGMHKSIRSSHQATNSHRKCVPPTRSLLPQAAHSSARPCNFSLSPSSSHFRVLSLHKAAQARAVAQGPVSLPPSYDFKDTTTDGTTCC